MYSHVAFISCSILSHCVVVLFCCVVVLLRCGLVALIAYGQASVVWNVIYTCLDATSYSVSATISRSSDNGDFSSAMMVVNVVRVTIVCEVKVIESMNVLETFRKMGVLVFVFLVTCV